MFRIVQISDTHLGACDPVGHAGWAAARAYINGTAPALVVHTGDIVRDDPRSLDDRRHARACLDQLARPWVAVPGNHDIGDGLPNCAGIDEELRQAFRRHFVSDHWVRPLGNWLLLGVSDLVFDTGSTFEAEQWRWLETVLAGAAGRHVALFLHKPPFVLAPDEGGSTSMSVSRNGARRLWALVRAHGVRLIACGHRHEYRTLEADGTSIVWAPTTSGLLDERTPPFPDVTPVSGLIEYRFEDGGFQHRLVPFGPSETAP